MNRYRKIAAVCCAVMLISTASCSSDQSKESGASNGDAGAAVPTVQESATPEGSASDASSDTPDGTVNGSITPEGTVTGSDKPEDSAAGNDAQGDTVPGDIPSENDNAENAAPAGTVSENTAPENGNENVSYMEKYKDMIEEMHPGEITEIRDALSYPEFQKYTYYSQAAERDTPVNVLLPNDYSEEKEYPVLYILHGFYDNEDWMARQIVGISAMLTNLCADGLAKEMIVVLPYIYCSKDMPYCTGLDLQNSLNYDNFINDLTADLMPFIESNFSVAKGKKNTAITGFSMGGRESLFIGFSHPERFGYIGAVCPAPGLVPVAGSAMHPGQMEEDDMKFVENPPYLLMVSAAKNDGVVGSFPSSYHNILEKNGTDHIWHTMAGTGHDHTSVTPHLYNFFRAIFHADEGAGMPSGENKDGAGIKYADSYDFEKLGYEGIEKTDFYCLIEAENAKSAPGVFVRTDKAGYSGEGYLDITDNQDFCLDVEIPASQYYKITVRHCAGSHKENPLLFNGQKALDIYSEDGDWIKTTVDGIFLEKGTNRITLGAGWSWFSLDSIELENGEPISDDIYKISSETLCNPDANQKTQNIYQYLKAIYGKRTLAGQCTNYGTNTETDALYLGTGKYPAVRTFDFIYDSMSFCHGRPSAKDVKLAIEWSKDGGLVVFDWHWYAPYKECAFYNEDTSFRLSDAVTQEKIALMDYAEIKKLFDDGKISVEALKIVEDIDNISALMQRMEDENVTVMWRPLHEASGGWFWWGASGADAYKWLWQLMYDRMTDYHSLDNLIWVWNGQDKDWYPGDGYCDIIAMDVYGSAHDYGVSPSTLAEVSTWAENGKLVTMSECATMPDPDLIIRDNAYWLWFAVWNWDFIVVNGTTELSDAYTSFEMMEKVYNSEVIITRDELPDFE